MINNVIHMHSLPNIYNGLGTLGGLIVADSCETLVVAARMKIVRARRNLKDHVFIRVIRLAFDMTLFLSATEIFMSQLNVEY